MTIEMIKLIGNWINWSGKLEERVHDLEEVGKQNILLKARIDELQAQVESLIGENRWLKEQLTSLLKGKSDG